MAYIVYCLYTFNVLLTASNFHNLPDTIVNWNFGFLLILDVRNILNKCSAEKPCEVNAGDCSFDYECRGNLICTENNYKGPMLSIYAKCCQEPGEDIFYISIWLGNYWWIFSLLILIIHISKKTLNYYSLSMNFCTKWIVLVEWICIKWILEDFFQTLH